MRRLGDSLGGLGKPKEAIPDAGRCLHVVGSQVLPHFPGASRSLRLPTCPAWTELIARTGEAVLRLGLDPLAQSAGAAQVDAFLDKALTDDRLLFGRARTR
jgi:hypothetical protein